MNERQTSHSVPQSNRDFDFFYEGLERQELLIQKCCDCGKLRMPPSPACDSCGSIDWDTLKARGTSTLYSYTIHYHPPLPGFETPHPVGIVELDEGIRIVGALDPIEPQDIWIGMPLQVEFLRRGEIASFRFGPVTANPDGISR